MKHFTINGKEYLGVKVPSDATDFSVDGYGSTIRLCFYERAWDWIKLPSFTNWQIVGLLSQIQNDEITQSLGVVDGEYLILKRV